MHYMQGSTVPVQQTMDVDQHGRHERSYVTSRLQEPPAQTGDPQAIFGRFLLLISLITGAISHGYHLFLYPLYITDEGIYMEQAWSVLREARLSPYTYVYDHAPAGWLVIAAWVSVLPHQFETFGDAINTGRALMLLVHVASTFLLFQSTRRLSGSLIAAVGACFLFNLSPLAIFYQRQVLLDNLMVFWVLLSLWLVTTESKRTRATQHSVPQLRVLAAIGGGLTFGIAILTKENAVFFLPAFAYLL